MFVEIVDISYLYPFKERAKKNARTKVPQINSALQKYRRMKAKPHEKS